MIGDTLSERYGATRKSELDLDDRVAVLRVAIETALYGRFVKNLAEYLATYREKSPLMPAPGLEVLDAIRRGRFLETISTEQACAGVMICAFMAVSGLSERTAYRVLDAIYADVRSSALLPIETSLTIGELMAEVQDLVCRAVRWHEQGAAGLKLSSPGGDA